MRDCPMLDGPSRRDGVTAALRPRFLAGLACALLPFAAGGTDLIPYEKFKLDNGLTVIVHTDRKAPIVAVNVWYHVGSKNEPPGKTGFAHLFEHLMFQGTEHYNDEYLRRQLTEDMAAVGIPLEFRAVSWRDLASAVDDHEAPAFMLGWVAGLPDPHAFLETLFLSQGSANYFDFRMPLADELLREGAREMNAVLRAQIYREAERVILQQVPLVPLHHAVGLVALRGRVHGLEPGPLGLGCVEFERVWVDPEIADPR